MKEAHPFALVTGARTLTQLEDNLACLQLSLRLEHVSRLDEISRKELGLPYEFLTSDGVHDATFGGACGQIGRHRLPGARCWQRQGSAGASKRAKEPRMSEALGGRHRHTRRAVRWLNRQSLPHSRLGPGAVLCSRREVSGQSLVLVYAAGSGAGWPRS